MWTAWQIFDGCFSFAFTVAEEEQTSSEKYDGGSVVVRVVGELIPSLPKRYCCFSI
jgi:hypothetical protein